MSIKDMQCSDIDYVYIVSTVEISGLNQKVSPTSTVAAVTIMNSIIAEATELLVKNGMDKPPIFYSANIDGGDELNRKIFEEYRDVIHYQY